MLKLRKHPTEAIMDNKKKDVTLLKLGGAFSALLGIVIFAQIAIAIAAPAV